VRAPQSPAIAEEDHGLAEPPPETEGASQLVATEAKNLGGRPPTHGAHSPARIAPVARAQRRRFLRQTGLRASDLEGLGLALLDNWARAQAKVALLDDHFAEVGFLDEDGEPVPATKVYFTALNTARLALTRLNEHMRERTRQPGAALAEYLEASYSEDHSGG
jgi:hypothetical protein